MIHFLSLCLQDYVQKRLVYAMPRAPLKKHKNKTPAPAQETNNQNGNQAGPSAAAASAEQELDRMVSVSAIAVLPRVQEAPLSERCSSRYLCYTCSRMGVFLRELSVFWLHEKLMCGHQLLQIIANMNTMRDRVKEVLQERQWRINEQIQEEKRKKQEREEEQRRRDEVNQERRVYEMKEINQERRGDGAAEAHHINDGKDDDEELVNDANERTPLLRQNGAEVV